ncbi:hypothetical protein [Streptomyces solaniscabiei]|uniref:hypothetical protein n=1 Tax=Streptomyces solaniscabiei TaxID=2683255 RepID=UPI001CE2A23D|nr:hypothetical protein [Streptomyces solaniscabiei]
MVRPGARAAGRGQTQLAVNGIAQVDKSAQAAQARHRLLGGERERRWSGRSVGLQ